MRENGKDEEFVSCLRKDAELLHQKLRKDVVNANIKDRI